MPAHTTIDYVTAWATLGTALGTLGLAAATFWMARKTRALAESGQQTAQAAERELELLREQADAAKRQSEAAEAALGASVRPMLIDVPLYTMRTIPVTMSPLKDPVPRDVDESVIRASIAEEYRTATLLVPVRNVGAGVALGLEAAVYFAGPDRVGGPLARGTAPSVIAAGEIDRVRFEDTPGAASAAAQTPLVQLLEAHDDLVVEVAYSDAAGRQVSASSFYLTESGRADRAYRVVRVEPGHAPRVLAGAYRALA